MGLTSIEWTNRTWSPLRVRVKEDAAAIAEKKGYTSLVQIATKMAGHVGPHCERVSHGCDLCYSDTNNGRCLPSNGTGLPFDRRARDLVDPFVDEKILLQPLKWRKPQRIFVENQSDLFGEWNTDEMIDRVFALMALCRQHTFQVLTKRPERMLKYLTENHGFEARRRVQDILDPVSPADERLCSKEEGYRVAMALLNGGWPLENCWLGVSCEDQPTADARIPELLQTPAAIRFVSYEPALGPVDFTAIDYRAQLRDTLVAAVRWSAEKNGDADIEEQVKEAATSVPDGDLGPGENPALNVLTGAWFDGWDSGDDGRKINWLIVGGESGAGARPFNLEWARKTIEQCRAAGVACFFKQAGSKPFSIADRITSRGAKALPDGSPNGFYRCLNDRKGGDLAELPEWANVRQFPGARV